MIVRVVLYNVNYVTVYYKNSVTLCHKCWHKPNSIRALTFNIFQYYIGYYRCVLVGVVQNTFALKKAYDNYDLFHLISESDKLLYNFLPKFGLDVISATSWCDDYLWLISAFPYTLYPDNTLICKCCIGI